MKLTVLTLTMLLMLNLCIVKAPGSSSPQQPAPQAPSDLQKLEAQFKEIDEELGTVKVDVSGKNESSGRIKIEIKREDFKGPEAAGPGGKPVVTKETSLDIDLANLNVPDDYINKRIEEIFTAPIKEGKLPGVKVMQIDATGIYEVVEDYTYKNSSFTITILKGFRYDRSSIPRIFWPLVDKDSLSNVPPLFHDLLYRHGGVLPTNQVSPPARRFSRLDADNLFLELMQKCGVTKWRQIVAYQAVRKFSKFAWNGDNGN